MPLTRRKTLTLGAAFGATSAITVGSPGAFMRAIARLGGPPRADLRGTRVIATLPAGSGPQELGVRALGQTVPDGPRAVVARRDGTIAILDGLNSRVAIVRDRAISSVESLPGAVYPTDVQESAGHLFVLDPAGEQVVELDGAYSRRHVLHKSPRSAVSRLATPWCGGPLSVVEEDFRSYSLASGRAALADGFPDKSGRTIISYPNASIARRRADAVFGDGHRTVVTTVNLLGSLVDLGQDDSARHYLLSSELVQGTAGVDVDLVVHRYEATGVTSGVARVPVRGRWSNPTTAVTIAPDGRPYAIVPEHDRTLLVELEWADALTPLEPTVRAASDEGIALAANVIPNCRSAATSRAEAYWNHTWYCNLSNWSLCGTTARPTYINTGGYNRYYYEVPYDWGGWASLSTFDSAMGAGQTAGNVNTSQVNFCDEGVDCSGFIQNCWGITDAKKNDTMLTAWCTTSAAIDPNNPPTWMNPGDMYRLPGQHVRMHFSYAIPATGPYVYESALANGDRVWFLYYPWAQLNGYEWNLGNFTC